MEFNKDQIKCIISRMKYIREEKNAKNYKIVINSLNELCNMYFNTINSKDALWVGNKRIVPTPRSEEEIQNEKNEKLFAYEIVDALSKEIDELKKILNQSLLSNRYISHNRWLTSLNKLNYIYDRFKNKIR